MRDYYKINNDIFDEYDNKGNRKPYSRFSVHNNRLLRKLDNNRQWLFRIVIILIIIFFIYVVFSVITRPPSYSQDKTHQNEVKLNYLIDKKAGELRPLFYSSLEILREHPHYYRKVVNNIEDIELRSDICPYACIQSYGHVFVHDSVGKFISETLLPEANNNKKMLYINPKGIERFNSPEKFSNLLVHETDHVEYLESSRLRRAALFIKCNPLFNPHISLFSNVSTVTHRVKIMEICAQRAEIDFDKEAGISSEYLTFSQALVFPFVFLWGILKSSLSLIKSMF